LRYRVNRKLGVLTTWDWFFINYGGYKGSMVDAHVVADHRTFKHVGFGAGLDRLSMNIEADTDDWVGDLQHVLFGFVAYVSFYF
jgi:hypothetical protein